MSDILAIEGELLPCPFCGGEASIFTSAIECDSCHCKMSLYDDDGRRKLKDGIARWNRRDAAPDPELLTAAWLHGADYARRKARWPEPTDEAAEQLARAASATDWDDMLLDIHNAIVTMGTYAKPLESELVGLTTTQWDHERARRVAAAVLARLTRAAIGAEGGGNRE